MSSWTKANSITEVQACLMTGPPPPRLQVQLNAGVLLNLLLDQPFGERLQEFDAETASLFGPAFVSRQMAGSRMVSRKSWPAQVI